MPLQLSPELQSVLANAFTGGIETTLKDLSVLLGWPDGEKLDAAAEVAGFVAGLGLELHPGLELGEFETIRVLRKIDDPSHGQEQIRQLMSAGEGPTVEFKSSLFCSMHRWQADGTLLEVPTLPGEILKTVCAFLNTEGGNLLIGVDDDGVSCGGIQRDLDLKGWNLDRWQLNLTSLIIARFSDGRLVLPYLKTGLAVIDSTPVARIAIVARRKRSFVRREKDKPYEYFVRNGPRSDSLNLPEFYEHLSARSGT